MFKGAKKADLRRIAAELGETVTDDMTMLQLTNIIKNSEVFESDRDCVAQIASSIIEERQSEEQREIEFEKVKLERAKTELEFQRLKAENMEQKSGLDAEKFDLDAILKSIKTLTTRVPTKSEEWSYFFNSLERAFVTKHVPESLKAEILLNLMGDKASNIIIYLDDKEFSNYLKVKEIILREYQPTPQMCLEQFRKAQRQPSETHVQFVSRLTTSFEYYLKLRSVSDFENLKQLMVSDKLFQTLDKETAAHISIRQSDKWFKPTDLAKEVDLYFTSRGRSYATESSNVSQKRGFVKNVSKVFLADAKGTKCVVCSGMHPLYSCPNYKSLPVSARIDVVKSNNLCFNCLASHKVINCKSNYSCARCKKRHHVTLHFAEQPQMHPRREGTNAPNVSHSERAEGSNSTHPLRHAAPPFIPDERNNALAPSQVFVGASNSVNKEGRKMVLLSTAECLIADRWGHFHRVRTLLDGGSSSHFLTKRIADMLDLKGERIDVSVSGLGEVSLKVKQKVDTTIASQNESFKMDLSFLLISKITNVAPSHAFNVCIEDFGDINLADENFNCPGSIDMLLGSEVFYRLLRPGQIYPPNTNFVLQNTVFGYVVSGSILVNEKISLHCGLVTDNSMLNETLIKFWEIETISEKNEGKVAEEAECEQHFQKTHYRDSSGRYVVSLPFKEEVNLGDSVTTAQQRFNGLLRKFEKNPSFHTKYKEFMEEYEDLGHMQATDDIPKYVMPHHGILRPESSTTKLRVVFDASASTTSGNSLNQCLLNGGVVQDDLFSILLRFREHKIVMTADIKKMYRQICVNPSDCDFQCILWKDRESYETRVFKLLTVTYGTKCAPFLATRVLKQLCLDERKKYPFAADVALKDFYVDDILMGTENLRDAVELKKQLIQLLSAGGMELHKWSSNCSLLLDGVLSTDVEHKFDSSNSESIKTLGLRFNPTLDVFRFEVEFSSHATTKRAVLSEIAKIFDPLGLLGPVIVKAKIFMQRLWLLNLNWDDDLPEDEQKSWNKFREAFTKLKAVNINRHALVADALLVELVGFADASKEAFGAVVYLRSISTSGEVRVSLLCSKSRVAPLKEMTIPRLELCAAELLSKLTVKVLSSLSIQVSKVYLFTDSMVVLSWIAAPPRTLKVFVANRVTKIQESTRDFCWRHVRSSENPADLISRGVNPDQIGQLSLWWNGPDFVTDLPSNAEHLKQRKESGDKNCEPETLSDSQVQTVSSSKNPIIDDLLSCNYNYLFILHVLSYVFRFIKNCRFHDSRKVGPLTVQEKRSAENYLVKEVNGQELSNLESYQRELRGSSAVIEDNLVFFSQTESDIFDRTNSFFKLIRICAYIFRFIANLRSTTKLSGSLLTSELNKGKVFLIKCVQQQMFSEEIKLLKSKKPLKGSHLSSLAIFLDNDEILRVGGRLDHSNLSFDAKHPILLPKGHKLTEMIFVYYHLKNFHVGPLTLLHIVRQEYWALGGRDLARKTVHNCITCFKAKPKEVSQIMAPLPKDRVLISSPFNKSGLDCCGPFYIKYKNQRKGVFHKIYVCIFVCFTTRAVHLEIITELTSEAMVACLKRFFSRRGASALLFSDNATNFRGAALEIKRLFSLFKEESVRDYLSSEGVSWSFIPPLSPNFGGLWEAGVKSFKYHLKRVIGYHKLTYEEFLTICGQIEAILNSRPLTPLSCNPNDFTVLTPGHFIIGRPINALPEPDISEVETNRLSRWQLLTKYVQLIWKNWSRDYLTNLQQRSKWHFEKNNVEVGTVVLLREDSLPATKWLIARIVEVFPGRDGHVRVVQVRLPDGKLFKRSVRHICILPNQ